MIIQRSQWHNKHMCAIILPPQDQSSLDDCMCGQNAEPSDPPLGCRERCAINLPLVGIGDKCCRGFESRKVGSVPKFRLRVASNDLELLRRWNPPLDLLISA